MDEQLVQEETRLLAFAAVNCFAVVTVAQGAGALLRMMDLGIATSAAALLHGFKKKLKEGDSCLSKCSLNS